MDDEKRGRVRSKMRSVRVSQASRRDAHDEHPAPQYESFAEERDALVRRMKVIHCELMGLKEISFHKEKLELERRHGKATPKFWDEWNAVKFRMNDRKKELKEELLDIETRLQKVKKRIEVEESLAHDPTEIMQEDGTFSVPALLYHCLQELREIKKALNDHH